MKTHKLFANLMLLVVAGFWGLTFPLIKSWANEVDASLFVTLRFLVGAIILLPFIRARTLYVKRTLLAGLILGLLNSGVYSLQVLALSGISAARCAFLTGTVVLWVPLFRKLLFAEKITFIQLISGCVCLLGLWILTGAHWEGVTKADGIMLLAEAFFGLALIYLERIGAHKHDVFALTFYQIIFTCLIPLGIAATKTEHIAMIWQLKPMLTILFCGIFATAISLLLQVHYQPRTSSEYASLIYATEPLWATLFASLFFHETLTKATIVGGTLMLLSVVLPELKILLIERFRFPLKTAS